MRIPLSAALFLVSVAAAAAANDGPWCFRDFGPSKPLNCSFYSIRHCLAAANASLGGICERNHGPAPAPVRGGKAGR